ncbi:phosphotransferase family protein [Streptantibioticus ferralitis]|uniref:Phosphotransferase n=1 Tax=Streptantibioticus ferralitis TaxID=236510 RepID=A0ABT5Z1T6_9ACTN|nr:phosphotransferase [Streptantibioticus ferralitis]MDF2257728.1 phosphotransferase [Streptantibioticus ferralitis]
MSREIRAHADPPAAVPRPRRPDLHELPLHIQRWVVDTLGSGIAHSSTQAGGFSPGAACRLVLDNGERAFLKAVSATANRKAAALHRREAVTAGSLPPDIGAPTLLSVFDDGEWVGLLMSDIDGRHPAQPWRADEVERVMSSLSRLHENVTPAPTSAVRTFVETHAEQLGGWRRLAAAPPEELDAWSRRHLDRLAGLERLWPAAVDGTTLLHADLRADNMLLVGNDVVFVDWAWACVGAAWVDAVAFAPSVAMQGGPPPQWLLDRCPRAATADPEAVTAVVAAVAGYFTEQALLPSPASLPSLRDVQARQGHQARAWLRERTRWR